VMAATPARLATSAMRGRLAVVLRFINSRPNLSDLLHNTKHPVDALVWYRYHNSQG
jgi:hypothetical protein